MFKKATQKTMDQRSVSDKNRGIFIVSLIVAAIPALNGFMYMKWGTEHARLAENRWVTVLVFYAIGLALILLPILAFDYSLVGGYFQISRAIVSYGVPVLFVAALNTKVAVSLGTFNNQ